MMPDSDAVRLTWLGQAGFRLELDGVCVVVDPWLSAHEERLIPPAPVALAAERVDWLLVTHEHLDHLDMALLPTVLERSPGVQLVLPAPLLPLVEEVVPRAQVVPVLPGDALDLSGVPAHVVPAYHGVTPDDAYGDGSAIGGRPRFVGYVLGSSRRLYHAGDTIVRDELTSALGALDVDVALLPINGRDAERESRGIVGNMDAAEAAELAVSIGATLLVPYHWDGFAGNTVAPGSVVDAVDGRAHVLVPARFEPVDVRL
jgi:L-ascorbate metabolism protein UlaG (beta-lactamase superfamily)